MAFIVTWLSLTKDKKIEMPLPATHVTWINGQVHGPWVILSDLSAQIAKCTAEFSSERMLLEVRQYLLKL